MIIWWSLKKLRKSISNMCCGGLSNISICFCKIDHGKATENGKKNTQNGTVYIIITPQCRYMWMRVWLFSNPNQKCCRFEWQLTKVICFIWEDRWIHAQGGKFQAMYSIWKCEQWPKRFSIPKWCKRKWTCSY